MYTTREGEMSEMGDPEWLVQFKSILDNQLFSSGQSDQVHHQQQQQQQQQHQAQPTSVSNSFNNSFVIVSICQRIFQKEHSEFKYIYF